MYKGRHVIKDLADYERCRQHNISYKMGAVDTAFDELDGIIDIAQLGCQYLGLTKSEMNTRLEGCTYNHREDAFNPDEYDKLVAAFRDLASRLNAFADEIESANND